MLLVRSVRGAGGEVALCGPDSGLGGLRLLHRLRHLESAMRKFDDSDMDEDDDTEVTVSIPIGERCFTGCRSRAVVNDDGMFCARCWLRKHRR